MSQGGIGIWVGVWDPAAWAVASLGFSVLGAAWKSCLCVVCVCVYQSLSVLNWCGFRLSWGRTLNPKPRLRLHTQGLISSLPGSELQVQGCFFWRGSGFRDARKLCLGSGACSQCPRLSVPVLSILVTVPTYLSLYPALRK